MSVPSRSDDVDDHLSLFQIQTFDLDRVSSHDFRAGCDDVRALVYAREGEGREEGADLSFRRSRGSGSEMLKRLSRELGSEG